MTPWGDETAWTRMARPFEDEAPILDAYLLCCVLGALLLMLGSKLEAWPMRHRIGPGILSLLFGAYMFFTWLVIWVYNHAVVLR